VVQGAQIGLIVTSGHIFPPSPVGIKIDLYCPHLFDANLGALSQNAKPLSFLVFHCLVWGSDNAVICYRRRFDVEMPVCQIVEISSCVGF
jgi:hypothetical protein